MTRQIKQWVAMVKERFIPQPGRILEIGSMDVNGSVRELFADATEYVGIDIAPGAGVDVVVNGHEILDRFGPASFDTVLCLEMLEHDDRPWITIANMHEVLKPGGLLVVSTPTFGFPEHRFPKDYYRFGRDAYTDVIFEGMELLELVFVMDVAMHPGICAAGRKRQEARIGDASSLPAEGHAQ